MVDLVVQNGKIVTPSSIIEANLVIDNGKIVDITKKSFEADEIIDAEGAHIIPGLIDAHVHFRDFGESHKGDWKSESLSAAAGGVTSVLEMPNNKEGINSVSRLEEKRRHVRENSIIDFGLYMGAENDNLEEILAAKNIAGVKFFLGKSTGNFLFDTTRLPEFFKAMKKKGLLGAFHCEKKELLEKYEGECASFRRFTESRPAICEAMSIKDVSRAMCDNRVHICHVTSDAALHEVMRAKKLNSNVSCEVCPQYLFLSKDDEEAQGTKLKMYPPLRSKSDNSALLMGLRAGAIDMVSTDHAPHTIQEKTCGWKNASGGVPGVETRLPLILGHSDLRGLIETCARRPAEIFGIEGKGSLREGFDADFVIIDPSYKYRISAKKLHSKCGWTPFEGMVGQGKIIGTFVRGKCAYSVDEDIQTESCGRELVFRN